ncbi:MAG: LCP family protein [Clostridia bacterium]|nr:LCP family protein [Clostridia bacterium]
MSENRRSTAARPQQRPGQRPVQPGQRRPQNKRRRRRRANVRFIVFLIIIAVLAVVGGVLVSQLIGGNDDPTTPANNVNPTTPAANNDTVPDGDSVLSDDAQYADDDTIHAPVLNNGTVVTVSDLKITPDLDPNWMNVLLLGSDQRKATEPYRTDSMIICSINKSTGEVKLSSLMRDTAMEMNDLGEQSGLYRMNVAAYVGGPQYLMRFLNEKLRLNIEHYVMVDFNSFSAIAEQMGGIDIAVSQAEMEEINFNLHRQAKVAYEGGMPEEEVYAKYVYLENYGENVHLNGPQVLGYARIRKLDSDSMRTERQRKVLVALLDKLRTRNVQEIMTLAMSLSSYVTTDMSIDDILAVALTVVTSDLNVGQLRLPQNNTYALETRDGESMLYDTNWEANAAAIHEFIYGN